MSIFLQLAIMAVSFAIVAVVSIKHDKNCYKEPDKIIVNFTDVDEDFDTRNNTFQRRENEKVTDACVPNYATESILQCGSSGKIKP